MYKRLLSWILILVIGCICVGCGGNQISAENASETEVVKIGNETITLDYIYLYAIQYIYTYKTDEGTISADMSNYKNQILEQLRSDEVQYQKAKEEGIELTEEEEKEMEQVVERYYSTFPEELLGSFGITKEVVTELFMKQRYLTKLSDETTKELENQYQEEAQETLGDKDFYELYYLLFPTIEYGEDGQPVTDDSGKYVEYSEEDKEKQKELAEEAKKKLEEGEEPEKVAGDYGISDYSDTNRAFKGLYNTGLEDLIADLESGDISEVYEDEMGYMVVKMINSKDEDYKQYYIETYAVQKASEELENAKATWLNEAGLRNEDIIGDVWSGVDISVVAKKMKELGVLSGN